MALPTDTAGPFDVKTDDLIYIDAEQAVDLFRQLLVIEAVKAAEDVAGNFVLLGSFLNLY